MTAPAASLAACNDVGTFPPLFPGNAGSTLNSSQWLPDA